MTPKERVIAALTRHEPDLVPHFEWILDPAVRKSMTGLDSELDFVEAFDLDAVAVAPDMRREAIDAEHHRDEWGIIRVSWGEYPNAVGHPVTGLRDLARLRVPDADVEYRFDAFREALRRFGGRRAVILRLRDVFSQPRDLMGFTAFLEAFYDAPDLVRELMRLSVGYSTRLARNARELGGEIIVVGDDIAGREGMLISPEMFRDFVLPPFRRLVRNFKDLGFLVIKHSDGDIMPVLDDFAESGIDCIDPVDPLAGMNLGMVKSRYGDRLAVKGNVDCVSTLVSGTPAQVRTAVRACLRAAGEGGGYILSSSNSIHAGVNPELYRAMLEARADFGRYPLDLDAHQEGGP
jgi:uroporphyrinogen decarboxylase